MQQWGRVTWDRAARSREAVRGPGQACRGGGGQAGAKTFVFVWGGVRRTVWCVCMGTSDADVAGGPRQGGATQSSDGKYTRGGGRGGEAARDVSKKLLEAHL